MTAMVHSICGATIANSVKPDFIPTKGTIIGSGDFYLAGTQKHPSPATPVICPGCGAQVRLHELEFEPDERDSPNNSRPDRLG